MKKLALVAVLVLLAGCASPTMHLASSQEVRPPSADKAQVVFMRTSFVGGAIGADLFEIVDGKPKYIGTLGMGKKIAYETTPGRKVFMAYGMAADFMLGELASGRTYYSIVRPNWGSGGMIPTPVRANGTSDYNTSLPEFRKWVSETQLIEANPAEATDWMSKQGDTMQKIYNDYWAKFEQKSESQKSERTLRVEDGLKR